MKKTLVILHLIFRYFLATIFISYAAAKILGTQFSTSPSTWDKTVGELSGFELTWFFYGYSSWYGIFIASSQIIAAFLLFFRKTTRLGIVLYLCIIVNILVLDFAYEIDGAKSMAILLTVIALFVFFLEFKSFFEFFIKKPPLYKDSDRPKWINKFSKAKFGYIPIAITCCFLFINYLKVNIMTQTEFYGAWEPVNKKEWSRIYFEGLYTFRVCDTNDLNVVLKGFYKINKEEQTIQLLETPKSFNEEFDPLNIDYSKMNILDELKYNFEDKNLYLTSDTLNLELLRLK